MITLESGQTVYGSAEYSASISYTFTGLEISGSVEFYKVLAQNQLSGTTPGLIYTVPSSRTTFIKQILFANTRTGSVGNIKLYIGGTGSINQIVTLSIPLSGSAKFDATGWEIYDFLGIVVKDQSLTTIYDDSNDPISYLGNAIPGTLTGSANWRISKIDTTSGIITTWADGNSNFDNIWENRVSLSYI